jgi:HAD superfamily hydrolase (TIGR01509 family)
MAVARASGLRRRELDSSSANVLGMAAVNDAVAKPETSNKLEDTSIWRTLSGHLRAPRVVAASFTALVASLYLRGHTCAVARAVHSSKSAPQSPALPARHRATRLMRIALLLMCLHPAATRQMGKPRAVLFDFDGSLAQSEEAHRKRFVAATGVACDSARWDAECVGRNTEWIVCHLLGVDEPPAEVIEDLRQRVVSDAFLADVAPTKGGLELLKALREAAVPCAVVTSGLRAYVEACLERWGVAVDYIVAGDDEGVPHKPAPDPYLTACDHFAVAPADCVAVEDSPSGLQSALAAGVPVVAIANPANAGLPLLDEVRAVQGDLTDRAPFGM